jgi:hypothetical protein
MRHPFGTMPRPGGGKRGNAITGTFLLWNAGLYTLKNTPATLQIAAAQYLLNRLIQSLAQHPVDAADGGAKQTGLQENDFES